MFVLIELPFSTLPCEARDAACGHMPPTSFGVIDPVSLDPTKVLT